MSRAQPTSTSTSTSTPGPLTLDSLDSLYSAAINTHPSNSERKQNPFMLSHEAEAELEQKRKKAIAEGRDVDKVGLLEVGEVREKYLRVVGLMEEAQEKEREREKEKRGLRGD